MTRIRTDEQLLALLGIDDHLDVQPWLAKKNLHQKQAIYTTSVSRSNAGHCSPSISPYIEHSQEPEL